MRALTYLGDSRRGVSSVVGAALALVILITFFTGVFLWTVVVEQSMDQLDWEKKQETIEVTATFSLTRHNASVQVNVRNGGAIDVRIVSVWLIMKNTSHVSHLFSPPKNVPKGTEVELDISHLVTNVNLTEKSSFDYHFKVITDRGNIATTSLVSVLLRGTSQPLVVIPGSRNDSLSYVQANGTIHLLVWNSLPATQKVDYLVITGIDIFGIIGPYKRTIIPFGDEVSSKIICQPGRITPIEVKDYRLMIELNKGETVFIELVNDGLVICTHYFSVD